MTADQSRDDLPPIDFDLPELVVPDDAAIRRSVLRGVIRAGFAAAVWLLVGAVVLGIAWTGIGALRTERFARLAFYGVQAAHPEYEIKEGHFANFGTSTMQLRLQSRGSIGHHGEIPGWARQPVLGGIEVDLGRPTETPIREALTRGRPEKPATSRFLDGLPPGVSASAIIELTTPLAPDAFEAFRAHLTGLDGLPTSLFLTSLRSPEPYITWPTPDLTEYISWTRHLTASDDEDLATLGLPSAATLRKVADGPRVFAFVVPRASAQQLRELLTDPTVRSVNVADVGFDVDEQSRG